MTDSGASDGGGGGVAPDPPGPLLVACLRHADRRPAVDPVTGRVDRDPRGAGPAASEWAALELALHLAELWGGRVLAVCAGPPDADRTLRDASAVGAQVLRVIRASAPSSSGTTGSVDPVDPLEPLDSYLNEIASDGSQTAAALAAAIRTVGQPDLVLCGDRSADRGSGSVPAFSAAEPGKAAQALGLVQLHATPTRPTDSMGDSAGAGWGAGGGDDSTGVGGRCGSRGRPWSRWRRPRCACAGQGYRRRWRQRLPAGGADNPT